MLHPVEVRVVRCSQDALVADDLVEIKPGGAVKPRPPTATSVPGLLSLFHNEWDATMLETHALREQVGGPSLANAVL